MLGQTEAARAQLDHDQRQHGLVDLDDASEILASVPDLRSPSPTPSPSCSSRSTTLSAYASRSTATRA
jgi:hypothetical protein